MSFRFPLRIVELTAVFAVFSLTGFSLAKAQTPADQAPAPAAPAAPAGPDYPDPRTFTIGAFYWLPSLGGVSQNPDVLNPHNATSEQSLPNFGKYHDAPLVELSMPVTRTGVLHLDILEVKGTGSETSPLTTYALGLATAITKGDYLDTQYQIKSGHIYLDDLLFPHKFPVSRLRFKSLWGFEYFTVHATATNSKVANPVIADDSRNIILPTFGVAMEYAVAKHVLFRVSGAGFGLYHRADIAHAEATLSYRRGSLEVVAGEKLIHFKSSPQNTGGFIEGTPIGAFAGLRWHF